MVRKEVLTLRQQLIDRDETISELRQEIEVQAVNNDATIKMLKERVQYLKNQLLSAQIVKKEPTMTTVKDDPTTLQSIEPGMHLHVD